ncbi:hypothetical protein AAVH_42709, partial [Aphelenchoides avenae]
IGISSLTLPACPELTDEAIIRFCFDNDAVNPEGDDGKTPCSYETTPEWRVLRLAKPRTAGDFLVKLMSACRSSKYDNNLMLIILDAEACEAQFEWAFHGNHLNATQVEFDEDANFPYYRFYFRLPGGVGVQLSWCTSMKAM